MKTAIYSRFSTDRQTDSSIQDQNRVCGEYAERQGWKVVARFEDQGISGAALGNRPGVLKLREAALARRFDVVLVTDLSRLSRSNGDLSTLIDRLVNKGIRVIGCQDGYDSGRKGHKLQAGLSGIIGEAFREMIKDRTYTALETRARAQRATGGRAYGYRGGKVDKAEAAIVREIFERLADGASTRTIAAELNQRGVSSPGASWDRSIRRASGWMGSGVRVIVLNPRYRGEIVWNQSEWRKDPDSGRRSRIMRPRSEWITHTDESLRIVSDDLWNRAQHRMRPAEHPARSGGKPKYLLSGLLKCDLCGASFVGISKSMYGCSSSLYGGACSNRVRVRRDKVEQVLVGPIKDDLLAPARVQRMAVEAQAYYAERVRAMQTRAIEQPRELQELDARIDRLRARLKAGDPDMTGDEIQAAIDRAEAKRRELQAQQPEAIQGAKVLSMLPKAAALYRQQITDGLDGDERAALKARIFLKDWFGGKIRLVPDAAGGLMAHWELNQAALLKAVGTNGSGGRI
jgi:DNA invertase Pin-like site-specific DNA recombinase